MNRAQTDVIYRPLSVRSLELPNRIVMAPMTRYFSPRGVPGENVARYYERRAQGGVGLILTEGIYIDHVTAGDDVRVPRLCGDIPADNWRHVTGAVHAAGGKIGAQLWHIGQGRPSAHADEAVILKGPSGLNGAGRAVGLAFTEGEIEAVISSYARSAALAVGAGFDAIEIHGAHGYLVDQFLWQRTNKRVDDWGGDAARRLRFAIEIVKACRRAVGDQVPISFRISQWKLDDYSARLAVTPDELAAIVEPLSGAGVDIFHCSTRRFWESEFPASRLNLAGWVKKLTGKCSISVGSIGLDDESGLSREAGIELLLERLGRDEFDLFAVGRALIADPEWALKLRRGEIGNATKFHADQVGQLV